MFRRLGSSPLLFPVIAATAAAVALALAAPAVAPAADPPVVANGAEPADGNITLRLQELWRVGGDEDDEIFFGVIIQALTDQEGNIYLLDTQLSEVLVLTPEGHYRRTLSREGEGPGEIRRCRGMQWLPDGTLGLVQSRPGHVVRVDREGLPLPSLIPGADNPTERGLVFLNDLLCRDGWVVLAGSERARGDHGPARTSFVAAFAEDGSETLRYLETSREFDFRNPTWIERDLYSVTGGRWTLGREGRVFAALDRDRYAVTVFGPQGDPVLVIEKDEKPRRRSAEEKQRIAANARLRGRHAPQTFPVEVEDTDPAISNLRVDEQGRLWVMSSNGNRAQPEGILCSYDVFDPTGKYVQRIQVACEGNGEQDRLQFIDQERVIRITGLADALAVMRGDVSAGEEEADESLEDALMEVICYRILQSGPSPSESGTGVPGTP